ncbi:MAG: ribulokinase [Anaerolineales bacterium]|nr:MAG: ribulokinase [Anaerolineales bacterium]
MSARKYTIGIDFGTESGRAVLVDVATGEEIATSVYPYANGVIDERLPESDVVLDPGWALQDPQDYLNTFQQTIPAVLKKSGIDAREVIGIGVDFTACTMMPTKADGTPLCFLLDWRANPHAWVKLWKHHAAQPEADRINAVASERGETWLNRYGGKISSEWFFSKTLQILNEAPDVYNAADRLIEAADWVVWQLTGIEKRNSCTAGYKAMWSKREGYPQDAYFALLDERLENVIDKKMLRDIYPIGEKAGEITPAAAELTGLLPGTAVAIANVDAHVSVPAVTVTDPGRLVMIMGTSICHMILGQEERNVEGMCGVVEDGIMPGLFGFEAGQSGVGDIFAWFVDHAVPREYFDEAASRGIDVHKLLEELASKQKPGEHGLLALDWWNGNRSILVDVDLSGMFIGATMSTKAEDIYRALIESTAYGTRVIIEAFERHEVTVDEIVACGGLPDKNPMLMQIYADVTGREIMLSASNQAPALGSAMFGAVAAGADVGGYETIFEAVKKMAHLKEYSYRPDPENQAIYERLYAEYVRLHDYFGRGDNDVMKTLKGIRDEVRAGRAS